MPRPGVGHAEAYVRLVALKLNDDLTAFVRKFYCVGQQIKCQLLQTLGITLDEKGNVSRQKFDRDVPSRGVGAHRFDGRRDDVPQIHHLPAHVKLAVDDAADFQQVFDQLRLQLGLLLDDLDGLDLFLFVERVHLEQLRPAEDRRKGGAQLMREDRKKLVLNAPVLVAQFFGPAKRLFILFLRIDVSTGADPAMDFSVGIVLRHCAGKKPVRGVTDVMKTELGLKGRAGRDGILPSIDDPLPFVFVHAI